MEKNYPMTCVSGYWQIKNKHGNKFDNWFIYGVYHKSQ